MHRRIPVEARAPLPTESFEDQLVRKAQARHAKRRRDVHLTLYGGKPADLQTEIEQLSDEEDMHQKTIERIAGFGRASFIPLGKTQRSLDESADSDGGATEREISGRADSTGLPDMETDEMEAEGDELVGGDLDAEIEDMDASASVVDERSGITDAGTEGSGQTEEESREEQSFEGSADMDHSASMEI